MFPLRYISTRSTDQNRSSSFEDILLAGLAPDGGLYLPASVPSVSEDEFATLRALDYPSLASSLLARFTGGVSALSALDRLAHDAYVGFRHPAIAPLKQLGQDEWLLELFHGPTLAFKDYALQLVGRLFDHVLAVRQEHLTIVGATSGDTGSAAIEACRECRNLDVFILFPRGRVSEVQRRQMTTVDAANVHTLAIDGTFDDCQDMVKAMFADTAFRERQRLGAVNSINWARIAAQIVYYFWAALTLGAPDRPIRFAVPTGNFGNVYAGHMARLMGLPIDRLVIGTNRNDILWRFMQSGEMRLAAVEPSFSPSMDIQVSSNFERLYFELAGRNGGRVADEMAAFRASGALPADPATWHRMREDFAAHRVSDAETEATIKSVWQETGELIDPHTAVAVAAMRAEGGPAGVPRVALACAHPAKFPDVVYRATGRRPALPPHLADLMERPERIVVMPNALDKVQAYIASVTGDRIAA